MQDTVSSQETPVLKPGVKQSELPPPATGVAVTDNLSALAEATRPPDHGRHVLAAEYKTNDLVELERVSQARKRCVLRINGLEEIWLSPRQYFFMLGLVYAQRRSARHSEYTSAKRLSE